MNLVTIRKGRAEDLPAMLALITELAEYEKAAGEVEVTVEQMNDWGFGEQPLFRSFVAESRGSVVGIALFYNKYSTWKGKCIFLEDIIVTAAHRRQGIGEKLFMAVAAIAKEEKVKRLEWQVLEWNEPAIAFYKKFNTHFDGEWINCKLTGQTLQSM